MDIDYAQLETALQESFRCYLAFLSHSQKHQQLRLPRRGKGVETTSDVSSEELLRGRAAAAEICLRYAEKIARRVTRWVADPEEDVTGVTENLEYPALNLGTFLPDSDICPFVDPFTGQWISPRTPHSAESSRRKDEEVRVSRNKIESLVKETVLQRNTIPSKEHSLNIKAARSAPTPLADEIATPKSNTISSISSNDSGDTQLTPLTTTSSLKTSNETCEEESSNEEETSDEESTDDEDFEHMSVTSEQANSFYKLPQCEIADEAYARLVQSNEQQSTPKLDDALAQAQKLASEWEHEQRKRLREQEAYAKRIEKKEKEEAARIARDRDIAKRAQEQIQWELDAIVRETEAMRAEERKRRAIEEENKAKLEREKKRAAEEAEQQQIAEEARRKREEELRRKREKRRQEAEERRQALARQTECISCLDMGDRNDMAILRCKHAYCGECISRAFRSSLKSRTQFTCCRLAVPITTATTTNISPPLSKSTIQDYTLMELELTTKNPTYCSSRSCHRFIPQVNVKAQVATCPRCSVRTCAACGKKEHSGVCREDKVGKAVKALARKKGWKACPGCSQFVDKTEGCLHMTCRCKAEWCYSCLRQWSICNSTCERE